jgi:hypothetical protein
MAEPFLSRIFPVGFWIGPAYHSQILDFPKRSFSSEGLLAAAQRQIPRGKEILRCGATWRVSAFRLHRLDSPRPATMRSNQGRFASSMQGEKKERWMELCAQAAVEQDPEKLMALVREINSLLEEKEQRLGLTPPNQTSQ